MAISSHSLYSLKRHFTFTYLTKKWKFLADKPTQEYLQKWSLTEGLSTGTWSFNEPFQHHRCKELITALLKTSTAPQFLPWEVADFSSIIILPIRCSVTSMNFFDRLFDSDTGVALEYGSGVIRGCMEEFVNGITLSNLLQQLILNEDHQLFDLYSTEERQEFIFRIFGHLIIGGQWCQYEDNIHPYLNLTKLIYKDLISVQRNPDGGKIEVRSICFVLSPPADQCQSIRTFAYAIVDPGLREITLFTHQL